MFRGKSLPPPVGKSSTVGRLYLINLNVDGTNNGVLDPYDISMIYLYPSGPLALPRGDIVDPTRRGNIPVEDEKYCAYLQIVESSLKSEEKFKTLRALGSALHRKDSRGR